MYIFRIAVVYFFPDGIYKYILYIHNIYFEFFKIFSYIEIRRASGAHVNIPAVKIAIQQYIIYYVYKLQCIYNI